MKEAAGDWHAADHGPRIAEDLTPANRAVEGVVAGVVGLRALWDDTMTGEGAWHAVVRVFLEHLAGDTDPASTAPTANAVSLTGERNT